ncbi:thioredoxin domain-containing protein [Xanthobacteraceae bacterium Astr-EGSB]|uniref:thioredoxin domain-containing protein n=1 Tax=Astrobacterium formosum TaxID=3069710 RepID=UPI0027B26DD7|nr:thioredoxin domain-containing protein [Xanthobacteraceae bacterium Astr-EGSB]
MVRLFAALLLSAAFLTAAHAQVAGASYPINGEDGTPVANHRIPAEIAGQIETLPGAVVIGDPRGDVTLVEFYDLNCPYCRKAAADVAAILAADKKLRLILVPFPVLGIPSIAAARVEIAVARLARERFHEFHRRVYAGRGTVDGNRALAVTKAMGLSNEKVIAAANDDAVTEIMKAHVRLGNAMGLAATPAFVVKDVALLGHPGRAALEDIIRAVRTCGAVVCE